MAEETGISFFGASPTYQQLLAREGVVPRERFDGPRALREEVKQLEPAGTRGRLPDAGDLFVDRGLQRRRALRGTGHNSNTQMYT